MLGPVINEDEKLKDPQDIRFIHQTIADTLSKPKPGEAQLPHLEALVRNVREGQQSMLDFPPIEIFRLRDPATGEKVHYSLNNRKLYIAKKAKAPKIRTKKASFTAIIDNPWKFTSESDGLAYPTPTREGNREAKPRGLLLQWREFIETRLPLYRANTPQGAGESAEQRLYREAQETFHLKCRFG